MGLAFVSTIVNATVLLAILTSKNLLRLRCSSSYVLLITSLVAADGWASVLLGKSITTNFCC